MKWQKITTKRGFTLIEMLIVISIIAILAFLGIDSFSDAQRRAKLNVGAESLASMIKGQVENVRDGIAVKDSTGKTSLNCYGFGITADRIVNSLIAPYDAPNDDCTLSGTGANAVQNLPFDQLNGLKISELDVAGKPVTSNLVVYFKPPFANAFEANIDSAALENTKFTYPIQIKIQTVNGGLTKIVTFDPTTNKADVSQIQ